MSHIALFVVTCRRSKSFQSCAPWISEGWPTILHKCGQHLPLSEGGLGLSRGQIFKNLWIVREKILATQQFGFFKRKFSGGFAKSGPARLSSKNSELETQKSGKVCQNPGTNVTSWMSTASFCASNSFGRGLLCDKHAVGNLKMDWTCRDWCTRLHYCGRQGRDMWPLLSLTFGFTVSVSACWDFSHFLRWGFHRFPKIDSAAAFSRFSMSCTLKELQGS